MAQAFNRTLLSGCIRQAERRSMDREGGVVLTPDGVYTKTDRPVKDVLQEPPPPPTHSRIFMLRTPTILPLRCTRRSLTRYPLTSQALMSRWWHDASTALTYQGLQMLRSLGTGVPASPLSQNISGRSYPSGPSIWKIHPPPLGGHTSDDGMSPCYSGQGTWGQTGGNRGYHLETTH